ncbi:SRPBCC family protein [Flavihumibacter sp. R14]|nr:SRPBCC family protein [Flavihumibacter soli]
MKFVKILLVILVLLVAIFFIGGQFLPDSYNVTRMTTIKASDSVVYKNVVDFNDFLKWNPWTRMEPGASVKVTGEAGKPGHFYQWSGEDLGKGNMKLLEVKPYSAADFELMFEEPLESKAQCHFSFEKVSDGTQVTWNMQGQSNDALDKWMYLTMDNMLGKDFDSGLKNLKELLEKN